MRQTPSARPLRTCRSAAAMRTSAIPKNQENGVSRRDAGTRRRRRQKGGETSQNEKPQPPASWLSCVFPSAPWRLCARTFFRVTFEWAKAAGKAHPTADAWTFDPRLFHT